MNAFPTPTTAVVFLKAGHATLTVKSNRTGDHRTFRVSRKEEENGSFSPFFLSLLTGPSNESSYTYVGIVDPESLDVRLTKKSKFTCDSVPVRVWRYVASHLMTGQFPDDAEIMHDGTCGACGRKLTTPESIDRGIGPDCWERMCGS